MKRKAVLVALAVLCVIAQVAGGLFAVGNENRWIGFLGVVLAEREVEVSKYGSETWYSLRCGDRRHDDVVLSSLRGPVGDVGDRTAVVFDRLGLQSPARPDEVGTAKAWLLPPALPAALGFVAFATTRRPRERDRGSAG